MVADIVTIMLISFQDSFLATLDIYIRLFYITANEHIHSSHMTFTGLAKSRNCVWLSTIATDVPVRCIT